MQVYKLKHKPTGLYYKKHGFLSERGSTYHSALNALTHSHRPNAIDIRLAISYETKYEEYKTKMVELYGEGQKPYAWKGREWVVPKDDFEQEIVGTIWA